MMTTETTSPRIYVASLSDYNAGRLHGRWIDAAQSADEIWEEINAMLAESREGIAEEWAIHDYEGFEGIRLSEYESIDNVAALAALIEEHGAAFAAYYDYVGGSEYATAEGFEDDYCGEWDSIEDYAENLAEDCAPSPDVREALDQWPYRYIDWECAARDLILGGDNWTADDPAGGIFVFRSS